MDSADKATVIRAIEEMARLMELNGDDTFRVSAHRRAARALAAENADADFLTDEVRLRTISGIGKAIAAKIAVLARTGESPQLDELRRAVPAIVATLARVAGVGPHKARVLHAELGIGSLAELEYACTENRLVTLTGFGANTQARVLEGVLQARRSEGRLRLGDADATTAPIIAALAEHHGVARLTMAGALRRRLELVDLAIAVAVADVDAGVELAELLGARDDVVDVRHDGARLSARLTGGLAFELQLVDEARYPVRLLLATGADAHLQALVDRARARHLELTSDGLMDDAGRALSVTCEDEIYAAIGLAPIPPELREGRAEVEAAARGELPRLVELGDLSGALHVHTSWSDGRNTLEEMVTAAANLGWRWIGISDHSAVASYANGLDGARLRLQGARIDAVVAAAGDVIQVLKGLEADILPDGTVDLDPAARAELDFVVASIHSRRDLDRDAMTRRLLRAIEDPTVALIGHPSGRLLGGRPPIDVDMEAVIAACARTGVALEINGSPHRLDLDWRHVETARARGAKLFVSPDAHRTTDLDNVRHGIAVARKGGLTRGDVINCRDRDGVLEFFRERRARAAAG